MSQLSKALRNLNVGSIGAILAVLAGGPALGKRDAERAATLAALEHACNAVRSEALYTDILPQLSKAIGCKAERTLQVLAIIGDVAGENKLPV